LQVCLIKIRKIAHLMRKKRCQRRWRRNSQSSSLRFKKSMTCFLLMTLLKHLNQQHLHNSLLSYLMVYLAQHHNRPNKSCSFRPYHTDPYRLTLLSSEGSGVRILFRVNSTWQPQQLLHPKSIPNRFNQSLVYTS
jgi:PhoPQ-activated pathogenicity-related protein